MDEEPDRDPESPLLLVSLARPTLAAAAKVMAVASTTQISASLKRVTRLVIACKPPQCFERLSNDLRLFAQLPLEILGDRDKNWLKATRQLIS
ncbi:MAG: hypothetical protein WA767_04585, partial [Pseudolabrys sp.]